MDSSSKLDNATSLATEQHVIIDGDELVPDAALAAEWNVRTRTLPRYDQQADGLPYVVLGGRSIDRGWRAGSGSQSG